MHTNTCTCTLTCTKHKHVYISKCTHTQAYLHTVAHSEGRNGDVAMCNHPLYPNAWHHALPVPSKILQLMHMHLPWTLHLDSRTIALLNSASFHPSRHSPTVVRLKCLYHSSAFPFKSLTSLRNFTLVYPISRLLSSRNLKTTHRNGSSVPLSLVSCYRILFFTLSLDNLSDLTLRSWWSWWPALKF